MSQTVETRLAALGITLATPKPPAANYIPKENYLAMLDEGHRWNRERFGDR